MTFRINTLFPLPPFLFHDEVTLRCCLIQPIQFYAVSFFVIRTTRFRKQDDSYIGFVLSGSFFVVLLDL